jgi:hypothetical protein
MRFHRHDVAGFDEKVAGFALGVVSHASWLGAQTLRAKALDPRLRGDDDLAKPCAVRTGQIVI